MARPLMSRMGRRHLLLSGAAAPLLLGATGCGYLLYPERKGRTGGRVDVPVLIIDLLWLLPGIIPGVICLIVDFTTGCIYQGHARASRDPARARTDGRIASAAVEIDGTIVARSEVEPDRSARLVWNHPVDAAALRARGRLVLRAPDGATAEAFVRDLS